MQAAVRPSVWGVDADVASPLIVMHDALVVGGGPAGLAASLYLARFRRDVLVIDAGDSRAARIPRSHNMAGFTNGVAGDRLIDAMRYQVRDVGVPIQHGYVERLERSGDAFVAHTRDGLVKQARAVLLATGALDVEPPMSKLSEALEQGALRYCPVCDGFEAQDRRIGVLCNVGKHGTNEALYLRHFTDQVTVFVTSADVAFDAGDEQRLSEAGIAVVRAPVQRLRLVGGKTEVLHGENATVCDSLYSALGMEVHSHLAARLGARLDDAGYVLSDRHQETCVPGLFVAGDVARGLNQISVAIGEAAIAASAMHLRLTQARPTSP